MLGQIVKQNRPKKHPRSSVQGNFYQPTIIPAVMKFLANSCKLGTNGPKLRTKIKVQETFQVPSTSIQRTVHRADNTAERACYFCRLCLTRLVYIAGVAS